MNILCTICMRGGSRGVRNKNLIKIFNKPLFYYSIKAAKNSNIFSDIVVSSDSNKIIKNCSSFGIKHFVKRPNFLAKNNSPKIPVIRHALLEMEKKLNKKYEIIIDLDVTSPLRKVDDIKKALIKFKKDKSDILFTVCKARKNPYFNLIEKKRDEVKLVKFLPKIISSRQKAPKVYDMNASIYIWKRAALIKYNTLFTKKTSIFLMSVDRSFDIDTILDLEIIKFLMKKNKKKYNY